MIGAEVAVHASMGKHEKGIFFTSIDVFGDENVGIKLEGISGALGRWVGDVGRRGAYMTNLVHIGDIPHPVKPEDIINRFLQHIQTMSQGFEPPFELIQFFCELVMGRLGQ